MWLHRYDGSDEQILVTRPTPPVGASRWMLGWWRGWSNWQPYWCSSGASKGSDGNFLCLNKLIRWVCIIDDCGEWVMSRGVCHMPGAAQLEMAAWTSSQASLHNIKNNLINPREWHFAKYAHMRIRWLIENLSSWNLELLFQKKTTKITLRFLRTL